MNNKRVNGKRKRITSNKMYKLQGKTKVTAYYNDEKNNKDEKFLLPKQVIIAIRSELEYGEPIVINGLRDIELK